MKHSNTDHLISDPTGGAYTKLRDGEAPIFGWGSLPKNPATSRPFRPRALPLPEPCYWLLSGFIFDDILIVHYNKYNMLSSVIINKD